jgi:hypothetical protein
MDSMIIHPDVLGLIVCDQIITDRVTGKQSLIGLFSTIHGFRFPLSHPQLCVHVSLTDGRGKTPISIRIVDADEARKPVVEGRGVVEFKNPRAIANLALQFHGLTFPEPGEYRVQLYSNDELRREARLMLVQAKPRPGQGGGGRPPLFTDPADGGTPPA